MSSPKYPKVKVRLTGKDGNAFFILSRCVHAAKQAGVPSDKVTEFLAEAKSSDYDHLLRTCMKWFNCD